MVQPEAIALFSALAGLWAGLRFRVVVLAWMLPLGIALVVVLGRSGLIELTWLRIALPAATLQAGYLLGCVLGRDGRGG